MKVKAHSSITGLDWTINSFFSGWGRQSILLLHSLLSEKTRLLLISPLLIPTRGVEYFKERKPKLKIGMDWLISTFLCLVRSFHWGSRGRRKAPTNPELLYRSCPRDDTYSRNSKGSRVVRFNSIKPEAKGEGQPVVYSLLVVDFSIFTWFFWLLTLFYHMCEMDSIL